MDVAVSGVCGVEWGVHVRMCRQMGKAGLCRGWGGGCPCGWKVRERETS